MNSFTKLFLLLKCISSSVWIGWQKWRSFGLSIHILCRDLKSALYFISLCCSAEAPHNYLLYSGFHNENIVWVCTAQNLVLLLMVVSLISVADAFGMEAAIISHYEGSAG